MIARSLTLLLAGGLVAGAAAWSLGNDRDGAGEAAPPPVPIAGGALFRAKGCATCHDGPETDSAVDAGPSLRTAATWADDRVAGLPGAQYLAQSITDPVAVISPAASATVSGMPTIAMAPEEVDAIVAYLLSGESAE